MTRNLIFSLYFCTVSLVDIDLGKVELLSLQDGIAHYSLQFQRELLTPVTPARRLFPQQQISTFIMASERNPVNQSEG